MSDEPLMGATADELVAGAIAELKRAQGLFLGPLTQSKKALLEQRLRQASRQLTAARAEVAVTRPADDPLPNAADLSNVVALDERRSPS